ncbi:uncharacterized protein LOC106663913 isoform X1 [Cimex lectularius]|uniref:Uncharacterized protein n=1 Tax=Cimex lectularius TaxID=79782 RepID=A0A8I6RIS9_CIMLE|nr:uncharacterized protein LOC106663913 isoform X1 [Cimex lectularius]
MSDSDQPPWDQPGVWILGIGVVSTVVMWLYLNNQAGYEPRCPGKPIYHKYYERYVEEPDWLEMTNDKEKNQDQKTSGLDSESKNFQNLPNKDIAKTNPLSEIRNFESTSGDTATPSNIDTSSTSNTPNNFSQSPFKSNSDTEDSRVDNFTIKKNKKANPRSTP